MKKNDQLSIVHAAYVLGADTPGKVERATGVPYKSASQCLVWIRKADGDLHRAWRLRCDDQAERKRRRYNSDPAYRARMIAVSTAWHQKERYCRNGYRVPFSGQQKAA